MHGDELLQQWKQAKQSCKKIIDMSIKANILKVPTEQLTKQQFINVYDVVYKLCSNPIGEQTRVGMVYKDFKDLMSNGLLAMSKKLSEEREVCKLAMLRRIFDAYQDALKRIKHLFALLDRQYVIKQAKIDQLDRTGITIIVTTLFTEERLLEYDTIYFKQIARIRKNRDLVEAGILKDYVQILYKFHIRLSKKQTKKTRTIYTDFQQKYLSNAKQYYINKFHKLQQLCPAQYFLQVKQQYRSQKLIAQQCFGTSSDSFINKIFSTQFLEEYRNKLIQNTKGLKYILQNREIQAITVITNLYKQLTNSIDGFKEPFQNFIYQEITVLLIEMQAQLLVKKSISMYISFIQKLIKKNIELSQILAESFKKFTQFVGYYKAGVQRAFSKIHLQVPLQEMLACYIDHKFRLSYNGQDAMKEDIRNVKNIFECLQNKDLFLLKYLQKLCKKIMTITPQGIQNHEHFVYHLKIHSGNKTAQKLQTILDQYKISLEQEKQYKQIQSAISLPYSMNLFIFSQAVWPTNQLIQFNIDQLQTVFGKGLQCMRVYQQKIQRKIKLKISFFDSRVRWIYYFEKEVQNKFDQAYLDTNSVQAILLQYIYRHRPQKISLSILSNIFSQIKPAQIRQSLQKMCDSQQSSIILISQIDSEIYYQFNQLMKSKKRMIQYDTPVQEQQQEQSLFQKKQLSKERQYAIDANVAKLMKAKKILSYDKIIEEVIKMIKVFNPVTRDIKASIERLLVKDVLVREDKDRNSIRYKD